MFLIKAQAILALGLGNIYRVLSYRLGVKLGLNPVRRITANIDSSPVFYSKPSKSQISELPFNKSWLEKHFFFGWKEVDSASPPDWYSNCFNQVKMPNSDQPWWLIPDFDEKIGDIKTVWEASRFDWVVCFAQAAIAGNSDYFRSLNKWLLDWVKDNPPYFGPNWKCGQEASIRLIHLALACLLFQQQKNTTTALQNLVAAHLARIEPTIQYAIGQDNNHGTSEAAALFIGGSWLALYNYPKAIIWQKLGRKWLENRANILIEDDGCFSQYSTNYHRLMLDTYAFAEVWRRSLKLPPFSERLQEKLASATLWLHNMPGVAFGDAVNLGANDGARIIPITDTDYRDFRPSVQLASSLFLNKQAFKGEGKWNLPLEWLNLPLSVDLLPEPSNKQFDNGGYVVLRRGDSEVLLNYPRFRFRPSQSDALHLDFWLAGENILRDGGSFSYNSTPKIERYFSGTESHNTVQFDNRDQMPKLSRFLFGAWLKTDYIQHLEQDENSVSFAAGYTDYKGASHRRLVILVDNILTVTDDLAGFKRSAVIRWRLMPGDWLLKNDSVTNGKVTLHITSQNAFYLRLNEGLESRYYLQTSPLPVLEIHTNEPGTFTTELFF